MEYELLQEFIDALTAAGQQPANAGSIIADDKWHRYKVAGDKAENASYQVAIEDGFAYGRFIYFKDGTLHKWHSKSKKKITPEEMKARKKLIAEAQKKRDIEEQAGREAVALECRRIWASASEAPHPYLEKKGIGSAGTKVANYTDATGKLQKNVLLIPVFKDGKLTSLQRIWDNGFKAFWEGGDVQGGYTAFVKAEELKDTIIICEGFATGASIREAMVDWPVIVAFNSGNLEAVAKIMRAKYKDSKIILAADNDQWTFNVKKKPKDLVPSEVAGDDERWQLWFEAEWLHNVGLEKAKQVGAKINAHVVFPNIPSDDINKNTDFNDLHKMRGLEAVRERILAATLAKPQQDRAESGASIPLPSTSPTNFEEPPEWLYEAPPIEIEAGEMVRLYGNEIEEIKEVENSKDKEDFGGAWRVELHCNDEGKIKANSLRNAHLFLANHPRYKGLFCFDEFTQEKIITRCPPWMKNPKGFKPRALRDEDVTDLAIDIELRGIGLNLQTLKKVLDSTLMSNKQNPIREYFSEIIWDGVPRLNTWLRDYCGCVEDDEEYLAAIGRKWLTAAVTRIFCPGAKFDHILIFEGNQNLGKSTMLRELATIYGTAYFDDTIKAKDISSASVVPKLQGCLIIELAEMAGFKKMPAEEAKQVLSTQEDRIIRKYANEPTKLPRQFVFAGTLNKLEGYLDDATGNRRYWPAYCTKIDLPALRRDKEQLWAEAVEFYRKKEKLYLEDAILFRKAMAVQESRMGVHPWQADIEKLTNINNTIFDDAIWEVLHIEDRSRRTKQAFEDITKIMTGLHFERKRKQFDGYRQHAWVRKQNSEINSEITKTEREEAKLEKQIATDTDDIFK